MSDRAKLDKIRDICRHPGASHWSGRQLSDVIARVIDDDMPIPYRLTDLYRPMDVTAVHDAVWGEQ